MRACRRWVSTLPTRVNSRSCSTRSSLGCNSSGRSPISSRNSVPAPAISNLPARRSAAPVNAPRSWPNSSLSSRPCGMAEQLTATNGARRRALEVDRARHQFLAGAALAADQHHVDLVVADHPPDELVDFLHRRAAADDLAAHQFAVEFFLDSFELGGLRRRLGRARRGRHHQVEVLERLGQVVVSAALERLDRVVHRAGRGDHDDRRRASLLARGAQHFEAAHAGHDDVDQGDVETPAG